MDSCSINYHLLRKGKHPAITGASFSPNRQKQNSQIEQLGQQLYQSIVLISLLCYRCKDFLKKKSYSDSTFTEAFCIFSKQAPNFSVFIKSSMFQTHLSFFLHVFFLLQPYNSVVFLRMCVLFFHWGEVLLHSIWL